MCALVRVIHAQVLVKIVLTPFSAEMEMTQTVSFYENEKKPTDSLYECKYAVNSTFKLPQKRSPGPDPQSQRGGAYVCPRYLLQIWREIGLHVVANGAEMLKYFRKQHPLYRCHCNGRCSSIVHE